MAPTSRFTRRAMLSPVDWTRARVVVELGSGTGIITRGILRRLQRDARFIAVEINDRFADRLRSEIDDPRLEVVHGSATDLPQILDERSLPRADAIISSLPFTSLETPLRHAILKAAFVSLADDGRMVSLQYTPFVLPRLLSEHFGQFKVHGCLLNVPPALIYTCTRSSSSGDV